MTINLNKTYDDIVRFYSAKRNELVRLEAMESGVITAPDGSTVSLPRERITALTNLLAVERTQAQALCDTLGITPVELP